MRNKFYFSPTLTCTICELRSRTHSQVLTSGYVFYFLVYVLVGFMTLPALAQESPPIITDRQTKIFGEDTITVMKANDIPAFMLVNAQDLNKVGTNLKVNPKKIMEFNDMDITTRNFVP